MVLTLCVTAGSASVKGGSSQQLFGFAAGAKEATWVVVNDGVMGGASTSTAVVKNGVLTFSGNVSLENNGGFASMRSGKLSSSITSAMGSTDALVLRVRGSGTTFFVTVDTTEYWYWAPITPTANTWVTVTIAYSQLKPRSRIGEPIDDGPYAGQRATRLGVIITNKQAEPFRLEIDWVATKQSA
jgi:NADH dehydrogenase [ubiquinone] 1 alpha subcomplex assembly factor 1